MIRYNTKDMEEGPRKAMYERMNAIAAAADAEMDKIRKETRRNCMHANVAPPYSRNDNMMCHDCGVDMVPALWMPNDNPYTDDELAVLRDFALDMKGKRVKP